MKRDRQEKLLFIIKHYLPHKKISLLSLFFISLLTIAAYQMTLSQSREKAMDDLALLLELRHAHLERYFANVSSELSFWSGHGELRIATEELSYAWQDTVKHAYLTKSPYPSDQREKLYTANSGNDYDLFHNVIHHLLKPLTDKQYAYADIMLVNTNAEIIYSVKKHRDYGQNLRQKDLKHSPLAKLYRQLSEEQQASRVSDAFLYSPADYRPVLFAGKNIYHLDGGWLGVLIFAIPLDVIRRIMQAPDAIPSSSSSYVDSYIVGQDFRLRTPSHSRRAKVLQQRIEETSAIKLALQEQAAGTLKSQNTQGEQLLTAYRFFEKKSVNGQHWVLLAEKPLDEVHRPSIRLFFVIFAQIVLLFLVAFIASRFILHWIEGEV